MENKVNSSGPSIPKYSFTNWPTQGSLLTHWLESWNVKFILNISTFFRRCIMKSKLLKYIKVQIIDRAYIQLPKVCGKFWPTWSSHVGVLLQWVLFSQSNIEFCFVLRVWSVPFIWVTWHYLMGFQTYFYFLIIFFFLYNLEVFWADGIRTMMCLNKHSSPNDCKNPVSSSNLEGGVESYHSMRSTKTHIGE